MKEFLPEGNSGMFKNNGFFCVEDLENSRINNEILESKAIICDNEHNLIVNLGCMKGIIPRKEGALGIKEGTVRDIAMISRVNRPVSFVVTGFQKDFKGETEAILSRLLAQEICMENYISKLVSGDIIPAKVTHIETFGAFVDIGCGIISFLPIDTISISRISHPKERFSVGMDIKVIVKSIEDDRINLTHKELLGTWLENAKNFCPGETVSGIIRSIEDYGVFVELTPNLAGLAEHKCDIKVGQQVSVYIKNIIPEKMKVKLVIIDTFEIEKEVPNVKYFFDGFHMDKFIYSPENCIKHIETDFCKKIQLC